MNSRKKKKRASVSKKMNALKKQRRNYVHQKKRKRKRKKRRIQREQAQRRRSQRERREREQIRERRPAKEIDLFEEVTEEESSEEALREEKIEEDSTKAHRDEPTRSEYLQEGQRPERQKIDRKKRRERIRRRKRRLRSRRRRWRWFQSKMIEIAILGIFLTVLYFYCRPKVVEELTIEAGGRFPELSEFLMREYREAGFTEKWEELLDLHTVADYEIGILIAGKEYTSILHVADTTAPIVERKDVQVFKDDTLQPTDFIEKIEDATKTNVVFVDMPDFSVPGMQKIELAVADEGGNVTRVSANMDVIEDTQPPVIEGVEELTVAVGDSISYKKHVVVSDDYDENVTLDIDNSEVDLNKSGDYPVIYKATDQAGNMAEKETVIHVKPASVETATEEMVNKKADVLLQEIITADMSRYEKAKAIFNWVHTNVGWSDGTPKTNWVQGAYRGLFERRGDCYVYAATSKCLLTQAGIANMDIGFSTSRRTHYWNLIDLGDGWYHFDTTRRTDGKSFFYVKDADIRAYSDSHNGSHAYDPSQYPTIQ